MKKTTVAICVPSPDMIDPNFMDCVLSIYAYTVRNLPHVQLLFEYATGVRTDRNRNGMLQHCLESDVDYILWLDADMIFQPQIIEKYLKADKDIIGCKYYKRGAPFSPVFYKRSKDHEWKYTPVDPDSLPKGQEIVELDALGFGGMMVKTDVYRKMGEDMWMNYGKNFHIPGAEEDALTHDINFCRKAQEHGFKIHLHTGVLASHIGRFEVTEANWIESKTKPPVIDVIMPAIDKEMAAQAGKMLQQRAGMPCNVHILIDHDRHGFIKTANHAFKNTSGKYVVYVAQDVFPGRNWLLNAFTEMVKTSSAMLGFNDGKWEGELASFGMVRRDWVEKIYDGNLFYPGYNSHYCDTELTLIAMQQKTYCYNPNATMIENDPDKDGKSVNAADKALFAKRKADNFGGLVHDPELLGKFA